MKKRRKKKVQIVGFALVKILSLSIGNDISFLKIKISHFLNLRNNDISVHGQGIMKKDPKPSFQQLTCLPLSEK